MDSGQAGARRVGEIQGNSNESGAAIRYVLFNWMGFTLLVAALIVLLPLHLEAMGFGVDAIAAVTAAAGVGGVVSADPVGRIATRIGAARTVRLGIVAMMGFVVGLGLVSSFWALVLLNGAVGVCISMIRVGSQLVIHNRVDNNRRGRVHARQGFITRAGVLATPVAIGVLWERLDPEWNFLAPTLLVLLAMLLAGSLEAAPTPPMLQRRPSVTPLATMFRYASGLILFSAARSGRMLLLPLIGLELELAPSRIGLLIGLTAAADVLTSPASGPLMDERGRLATIIPSFTLTAAGFAVLGLAQGGWLLAIAAVVLGLGNGLSSGLLLTLGTDLAPPGGEGPFLGRFGAMQDTGRLIGPFVVGLLGELLGLNIAAVALAVITAAGLGCVLVFIGETRPAPA